MALRQILARNIRTGMDRSVNLKSANALATKAGVSQSNLSKLLRCEASPTTDLLVSIANALDVQPWELLADTETTRQAALQKMLGATPVPDQRVEQAFPPLRTAKKKRN